MKLLNQKLVLVLLIFLNSTLVLSQNDMWQGIKLSAK